jgi:hypothetical protein
LEVLRALEQRPEHWKWGEFKQEHGFPRSMIDGEDIQVAPWDLEIALAAAGDEAAFQRILDEFEGGKGLDTPHGSRRYDALQKLTKVKTDRAVHFVGALLDDDDEILRGYPLAVRAAEALHVMIEDNRPSDPDYDAYWRRGTTESIEQIVRIWRTWWAENSWRYNGDGHVAMPSAAAAKRSADAEASDVAHGRTAGGDEPSPTAAPRADAPSLSDLPEEPGDDRSPLWLWGGLVALLLAGWLTWRRLAR